MGIPNRSRRLGLIIGCCVLAVLASSVIAHAQTGVLFVKNNRVGIGVDNPLELLHIRATDGTAEFVVVENSPTIDTRSLMTLQNNGGAGFALRNQNSGQTWQMDTGAGRFNVSLFGTGQSEFNIDTSGNVTVLGSVTAPGGHVDYVFEPDYELMPLPKLAEFIEENKHLPNVVSKAQIEEAGGLINMNRMQESLLEKVEELVLYTLQQQEQIDRLLADNEQQRQLIDELRAGS